MVRDVRGDPGRFRPHPDLSTVPLASDGDLETLVELPLPPGNVAMSPDGRVFFDLHPQARPQRFSDATVFELVDGRPQPYPSQAFQPRYRGPLGMTVDRQHRLWLVEPQGVERYPTRLLGFDLTTDQLVYEQEFTPRQTRVAQDLRVSPDGSTVYLADTGVFSVVTPRLLVLDLERRHLRTVLRRHPSVRPQRVVIRPHGRPFQVGFRRAAVPSRG